VAVVSVLLQELGEDGELCGQRLLVKLFDGLWALLLRRAEDHLDNLGQEVGHTFIGLIDVGLLMIVGTVVAVLLGQVAHDGIALHQGTQARFLVERELAKGRLALVCSEINQSLVPAAKSKKKKSFSNLIRCSAV